MSLKFLCKHNTLSGWKITENKRGSVYTQTLSFDCFVFDQSAPCLVLNPPINMELKKRYHTNLFVL